MTEVPISEVVSESKFCTGCRHFLRTSALLCYPTCSHPDNLRLDPVTGQRSPNRDPSSARGAMGFCGPSAAMWEAKPANARRDLKLEAEGQARRDELFAHMEGRGSILGPLWRLFKRS